jgi:cbb3-type cytochrome oxidase maturation protein
LDILYLLIPLSVVLVLMIVGVFGWAINNGQLDDLEREGGRILEADPPVLDIDQAPQRPQRQESEPSNQ